MGFDGTTPFATLYACCATSDDERAWGELIRRFHPDVMRVAAGIYRVLAPTEWGAEDVEDAAQEAWYRLMRNNRKHIRSFPDRSEGEFRVYLRKTAANVVRDRLKTDSVQKRPRIARLDDETREFLMGLARDPRPAPDELVHQRLVAERVEPLLRREWAGRPQLDRDVTVCALALMDGLSAQRIADIESIGLSRGGVEKVIDRGRRVLQKHFAGPGARSRRLDGAGDPRALQLEAWRDVDELLDFILGSLDAGTVARRMQLLARDADARAILCGTMELMAAPLSPELLERARTVDAEGLFRRLRRRIQKEERSRLLSRFFAPEARRVAWAVAAVLLVAVLPLRGLRPGPPEAPQSPGYEFEYPQGVAAPLRLAQPFSPEGDGPRRSADAPVDEQRMLEVEEALILERGSGADPVATSNALGHLKLARGQLALAERNYLIALQHEPNNAEALIGVAVVDYRRAELPENRERRNEYLAKAERALARVEPSSPLYLQALFDRIQVALAADDLSAARALLARYEELGPEDGWASALRAAVERAGR